MVMEMQFSLHSAGIIVQTLVESNKSDSYVRNTLKTSGGFYETEVIHFLFQKFK